VAHAVLLLLLLGVLLLLLLLVVLLLLHLLLLLLLELLLELLLLRRRHLLRHPTARVVRGGRRAGRRAHLQVDVLLRPRLVEEAATVVLAVHRKARLRLRGG